MTKEELKAWLKTPYDHIARGISILSARLREVEAENAFLRSEPSFDSKAQLVKEREQRRDLYSQHMSTVRELQDARERASNLQGVIDSRNAEISRLTLVAGDAQRELGALWTDLRKATQALIAAADENRAHAKLLAARDAEIERLQGLLQKPLEITGHVCEFVAGVGQADEPVKPLKPHSKRRPLRAAPRKKA